MGESDMYHSPVRTLDFKPVFVPSVSVKGLTWNSITIGWAGPNPEGKMARHIGHYKLVKKTADSEVTSYHMGSRRSNLYLWLHLDPATNYTFTVASCHGLTKDCGPASSAVSAATLDGEAGPPSDVVARCSHDNVSGMNFVDVTWREPRKK